MDLTKAGMSKKTFLRKRNEKEKQLFQPSSYPKGSKDQENVFKRERATYKKSL